MARSRRTRRPEEKSRFFIEDAKDQLTRTSWAANRPRPPEGVARTASRSRGRGPRRTPRGRSLRRGPRGLGGRRRRPPAGREGPSACRTDGGGDGRPAAALDPPPPRGRDESAVDSEGPRQRVVGEVRRVGGAARARASRCRISSRRGAGGAGGPGRCSRGLMSAAGRRVGSRCCCLWRAADAPPTFTDASTLSHCQRPTRTDDSDGLVWPSRMAQTLTRSGGRRRGRCGCGDGGNGGGE